MDHNIDTDFALTDRSQCTLYIFANELNRGTSHERRRHIDRDRQTIDPHVGDDSEIHDAQDRDFGVGDGLESFVNGS